MLTSSSWDCVAVPLPPSIEVAVESAIEALPTIHLVILEESDGHDPPAVSFIPIDPCQPVIMAIRNAMGEGVARAYIDREVTVFEPAACPAPDSYALKQVSIGAFAAAMVTVAPTPQPDSQRKHRIDWMAFRLHELELDYERIVCLCHVHDWPWVRDAYREGLPYRPPDAGPRSVQTAVVTPETLYFVLAELPYLTALFERRRAKVQTDRHLSIDGIKELLLATREHWLSTTQSTGLGATNWVTPQVLQLFLQYVRNLALLDQRLTPDLYSLSVAAKQIAGDQFAITLIETATRYEPRDLSEPSWRQSVEAGIDQLTLEDGRTVAAKNRLAGPPIVWRSLSLQPEPKPLTHRRWGLQWDPFRQCSWPPEDQKIESFTSHVRDQARALLGADLARVEKFTTSIKDGIDLRESLRNWPRKQRPARHPADTAARLQARMDVYVKDIPPARGNVDVVVFLFDTPADPARYSWRATWYAEHQQESTLSFYATDFLEHLVGPGVGQSQYGGALFLFPPRPIPDLWTDRAFDFAETLEERLLAGASCHSQESHVVLVSPHPPRARWRQIARRYRKRLIPVPLGRFSGQTVDRLRRFHVLNGHDVRSYAARFIR
ncbi:hypothetical protein YTPLAS18_19050 [Nitrospira sp.]|nr:hypothetical protein YTPLAS18_19050 [Nitrospira sp.]